MDSNDEHFFLRFRSWIHTELNGPLPRTLLGGDCIYAELSLLLQINMLELPGKQNKTKQRRETSSLDVNILVNTDKQANKKERIQRYLLKFLQRTIHSLQFCIHLLSRNLKCHSLNYNTTKTLLKINACLNSYK